jgi:DNA-binding Lrp family transcriptional regulator
LCCILIWVRRFWVVKAAILVTVAPGKVDDVAGKVRALEHITDVLTVAGRADVVALCEGTFEDISTVVRKVGEIDGVEATETLVELVS